MLLIRNSNGNGLPCKSTFNWWRTVVSSASDSMRHSNVAPNSFRVNTIDNVAFSVNKPFASGPSLVDIDSIKWLFKFKLKVNFNCGIFRINTFIWCLCVFFFSIKWGIVIVECKFGLIGFGMTRSRSMRMPFRTFREEKHQMNYLKSKCHHEITIWDDGIVAFFPFSSFIVMHEQWICAELLFGQ